MRFLPPSPPSSMAGVASILSPGGGNDVRGRAVWELAMRSKAGSQGFFDVEEEEQEEEGTSRRQVGRKVTGEGGKVKRGG